MALWSILIILIVILLIGLDFWLGKIFSKKNAPVFSYETDLADYRLITDGDEFFKLFFDDLAQAKKAIYIAFFIVENDAISQEFFRILQKKALSGVSVYLLMDWLGSIKVNKKFIKQLKDAGVNVNRGNKPMFPFFLYRLNRRNHRKIAVIDQHISYLGGYNVGKAYLGADRKLGHWKDYHIRLSGSSLANAVQTVYFNDWNGSKYANYPDHAKQKQQHTNSGLIITEAGQLEEDIMERINQASDSIFIGSPYFIPTNAIFACLLTALGRGVEVTVLAPEKADHLFVKAAALPFFKKLLRHGAKVFYYHYGFYHAKVIVIDQKLCDIGTANFDQRSLLFNQEINLVLQDEKLMKPIFDAINEDLLDSYPLSVKDVTNLPFKTKLSIAVSRILRPFL